MLDLHRLLRRSVAKRDEEGASAVEYGLLVVAIAALIVIIVFALGGVVKDMFSKSCDNIRSKASTTTTCAS